MSVSIRTRLALLFFAITLGSILVVYLYVAPSLEDTLRAQKVRSLQTAARASLPALQATVGTNVDKTGVQRAVQGAADRTGAHLTLLGISSGTAGIVAFPIADSGVPGGPAHGGMPLAMRAARTRGVIAGTQGGSSSDSAAVVALPISFRSRVARVALFSSPLTGVLADVRTIRRRIIVAGVIAMALALLAGMIVARALSLRIRRLEESARRVARWDFDAGFPVDSGDELGQLAAALDDMQRQLQELDSARKRFIATASHELRTPIFSLGGFLELIQDEELDEDTRRQFVGQVREQVDRLGKLATGLLDLSRLEAGSLELQPKPTDLGVLAEAVCSEFIPALNRHGSRLELRIGRQPVRARCDPDRVAQVLRILVDNAITHTEYGTEIVVSAAREDEDRVRLAVVDRGEGVAIDERERIFDPFVTSDGVQGSGLGLAIARELVERMRGHLTLESRPGRTVFTLGLPGATVEASRSR
ncbi:MAG: ATP-binding protein [Solirubrobacteraceae bacterium]